MDNKELKEFLAVMDKVRKEHTSTREKARKFLEEEGVLTEDGDVAEQYRQETLCF